jgi:predicted nucleic acid-binding protein
MTQNRAFYNLPVLSPRTAGEHRFLARLPRQCVLKLIREGKRTRANQLLALRDGLIADFKDRLLPLDVAVALMLGRLVEAARPKVIERVDLIIAATAKVHGLTVLSRSIRHFEPTGVAVLDPLRSLPRSGEGGQYGSTNDPARNLAVCINRGKAAADDLRELHNQWTMKLGELREELNELRGQCTSKINQLRDALGGLDCLQNDPQRQLVMGCSYCLMKRTKVTTDLGPTNSTL